MKIFFPVAQITEIPLPTRQCAHWADTQIRKIHKSCEFSGDITTKENKK